MGNGRGSYKYPITIMWLFAVTKAIMFIKLSSLYMNIFMYTH